MPADHAHHLAEHARRRHDRTLRRAQQTLTELTDAGEHVTVARLANQAGVSRSWIYTQPALLDRIQQHQQLRTSADFVRNTVTQATDDSLRQRLARMFEALSLVVAVSGAGLVESSPV
jgi:hypothetical protein